MRTSVTSVNLDWLLDDQPSNLEMTDIKDVASTEIPISKDIGKGSYEIWMLALGATVYRANYKFEKRISGQLIPMSKVTAAFKEPTLMIHTLKTGRVIHQDELSENDLIFGDGADLFRLANAISVTPIVDTSHEIEMTSLIIGKSFLAELIGGPLSNELIKNIGLSSTNKVLVKAIPSYVNHFLQDCLRSEYSAPLKKVWAQARILDFITELSAFFCDRPNQENENERLKKRRIKEVHRYLLNLNGKLPTINALAAQFGKSARALNEEFEQEYGESIFSFVVNHRLESAHEAIKSSPIPLKQIAIKLGYSHVNHFSAAFKKKFGYAPGSLRK